MHIPVRYTRRQRTGAVRTFENAILLGQWVNKGPQARSFLSSSYAPLTRLPRTPMMPILLNRMRFILYLLTGGAHRPCCIHDAASVAAAVRGHIPQMS
jgi:hypothetical protein